MKKLNIQDRVNVFCPDAFSFKDIDEYNYFFMYNPFPADVLKDVMINLEHSVARNPRKMMIIYYNPIYAYVIESNKGYKKELLIKNGNRTPATIVYRRII